jgi:hypothetical protein
MDKVASFLCVAIDSKEYAGTQPRTIQGSPASPGEFSREITMSTRLSDETNEKTSLIRPFGAPSPEGRREA